MKILALVLLLLSLSLTAMVQAQFPGPEAQATSGALSSVQSDVAHLIEERGMLLAFFSLFVLGLALNLTPCVYPMIPVTISYFSQQSEHKTSRVFVLTLMYLAGIAITSSLPWIVLALISSYQWCVPGMVAQK